MTTFDPDLIRKYRGVLKLAEQGSTEGERNAARNAAAKLEAKFPGLKEAAATPDAREMGADDGAWTPPAGFGMPGINVEAWIRDTLTNLFSSMEANSAATRLAKPLKVAISTSARGRLEITAVMQPAAFDKVVAAVEEDLFKGDDSLIDRWAEQIGKLIAAELATDLRDALNSDEDDDGTDYDDVDDDD
jgi:hypothetical protein